jgi:hypothetical protein
MIGSTKGKAIVLLRPFYRFFFLQQAQAALF